jgi:hypothetical protein
VSDRVEDDDAGGEAQQLERELPQFALVVSAAATGRWHLAALVREKDDRDFYLRSVAVRWPFTIARPAPSNRQNEIVFRPQDLSPAGTSPARKLVVNWVWTPADDGTERLHFFVKRAWRLPLPRRSRLRLRLGLKEQAPPRRRFILHVRSNLADWRPDAASRREQDAAAGPEA